MKPQRALWILASACLVLAGSAAGAQGKVTLNQLLDKMVTLDWLYSPPFPGEKQVQFSSYNRQSKIVNGEKVDWFANVDRGNYYDEETVPGGKEYVLADYQGPGVITRIWSANPGMDRWRIYLDGSSTPVIDEPGEVLLSGRGEFFKDPFAGSRAHGWLLMFPIPFRKSCKVTLFTAAEKKPECYFHVNIVNFPPGAEVETFSKETFAAARSKINEVGKAMESREQNGRGDARDINWTIDPGKDEGLADIPGPGVITLVELKIYGREKEVREILNRAVITVRFDQLTQPAVKAPLGAFFGSTPGPNTYKSIAQATSWDKKTKTATLQMVWPMPFHQSAGVSISNPTKQPIKITGRIMVEKKDVAADALYFHANYSFINNHKSRPFADWTLLNAKGAGRYVGTMLSVRNPDYMWWGEGDEKVFVDNDAFPSIFGTGTEDYFSYAWSDRFVKFDHADYGMSLAANKKMFYLFWVALVAPPLREKCSQYRLQVLDNIPFEQSIDFELELWHSDPAIKFDVQATSYWYGAGNDSYNAQKFLAGETPDW